MTQKGVFFVSRIRSNAKYRVLERRAIAANSGITSDQAIVYWAQRKDSDALMRIHRVVYRDPETGKHYLQPSNQGGLPPQQPIFEIVPN